MSAWTNLAGTVLSYFRIGLSGVRLKNSSGVLAVRNAGDSADASVSAAGCRLSDVLQLNESAQIGASATTDLGDATGNTVTIVTTSASYASKSMSVSSQEGIPVALAFSSDGTKCYVIGNNNDTVYQYTLSTAWDISTGSYASKSMSVSGEMASPYGLAFSSDGTKCYVVGYNAATVYQYTLGTAWDISTGSYASKSMSTSSQESLPHGLAFSSDGTKCYVVGTNSEIIYQYTLSTAWDISTGSYASKSMVANTVDSAPASLAFSSDGTKCYVVGANTDTVYQYTLSTAWDISTGSYASKSISVSGQETNPWGVTFSSDGTKCYVVGYNTDTVYQYALSTAWELTNASTAITSFGAASSLQAGTIIHCRADITVGTLSLTHNATSLIIPGAASITLADGDTFDARKISDSSAYWEVLNLVKPSILGLGSSDYPRFAGVNIGHATDTTLTRVSAGVVAVEGVNIVLAGAVTTNGITMATAKLLGRSTAATGAVEEITVGSGLSLSGGSIIATGGGLPKNYITGLTLANNASDATNDIDIAAGKARDVTDTVDMTLSSALVKQLDAAWAVGTNQGMLDTGTVGNNTYHLFLIKRSDTGVVDVLASLSATNTGTCTMTIASPCVVTFAKHGLQVGSSFEFSTTGALPTGVTAGTTYYVISTSFGVDSFQFSTTQGGAAVNTSGSQSGTHTLTHKPIMPASYDYKRRIGSIIRTGAAIVGFNQRHLKFVKKTVTEDITTLVSGTTVTSRTLAVPVGVSVLVEVMARTWSVTTNYCHFTSPDDTDQQATDGITDPPYCDAYYDGTVQFSTKRTVASNAAAQIRSRNTVNGNLQVYTYGWEDYRLLEGV